MAKPKAIITGHDGREVSIITKAENVLFDNGDTAQSILETDLNKTFTPTIENSSSMFKVGQGDSVDYSLNVVDGAYESCVLKGITLVNISDKANGNGVIPQRYWSTGTSNKIKQNTKYFYQVFNDGEESVQLYLNSNTMTNETTFTVSSKGMKSGICTSTSSKGTVWLSMSSSDLTKLQSLRIMLFEYQESMENWDIPFFEGICDVKSPILSNIGKNLFDGVLYSHSTTADRTNYIQAKPNTYYVNNKPLIGSTVEFYDNEKKLISAPNGLVVLSPTNAKYFRWFMNPKGLTDVQIEEGKVSTAYEGYKSNILSANGDKIELTEDMFEIGTVSGANGIGSKYETMKESSTVRLRSKDIIKVKPNTGYRLIREDGYDGWCVAFDSNQAYLGKSYQTETFVTDSQTYYIVPVLKSTSNATMLLEYITKFTLSEVDKTIVLRSLPTGVCDTLNVETGEYIQRIGEKVFSKSGSYTLTGTLESTVNIRLDYQPTEYKVNQRNGTNPLTDRVANNNVNNASDDKEGVYVDSNGYMVLCLSKTKATTLTEFVNWLGDDGITVQYELATPIVKTVNLSGFPYAYKDGHVILESGSVEQSLLPKVEYSLSTNRNGQIQTNQKMIEKHQKEIDELQKIILTNMVNSQYQQALTMLNYELSRV